MHFTYCLHMGEFYNSGSKCYSLLPSLLAFVSICIYAFQSMVTVYILISSVEYLKDLSLIPPFHLAGGISHRKKFLKEKRVCNYLSEQLPNSILFQSFSPSLPGAAILNQTLFKYNTSFLLPWN